MKINIGTYKDNCVSKHILDWLLESFSSLQETCTKTIELPQHLGEIDCALYGPLMGDEPILEENVFYVNRGRRQYKSRMVKLPFRKTKYLTFIVAYNNRQKEFVLVTVFGGKLAAKEPNDLSLKTIEEQQQSIDFWSKHALSEDLLKE